MVKPQNVKTKGLVKMKKSKDEILLKGLYKDLQELEDKYHGTCDNDERKAHLESMRCCLEMINDIKSRRSESRHKIISLVLDGAAKLGTIAIPACIYVTCFNKGLQFEETGVYKSDGMKNLCKKLTRNRF